MIETFTLYLILLLKPRFDDVNVVNKYPTMEDCELISKGLNEGNDVAMAGSEPTYRWVCKPSKEPEVEPDEDKL